MYAQNRHTGSATVVYMGGMNAYFHCAGPLCASKSLWRVADYAYFGGIFPFFGGLMKGD